MASVREQRQQQHHAMDNSSDDDDEQEGEWEEWGNGGGDDEDEDNVQTLCLFCEETLASPETVFKHCVEQHAFDFSKLRAASHLSLYDCLCLINFIRSRVCLSFFLSCLQKFKTCMKCSSSSSSRPVSYSSFA
jgi:protein arginine N-methyltransferase 3